MVFGLLVLTLHNFLFILFLIKVMLTAALNQEKWMYCARKILLI